MAALRKGWDTIAAEETRLLRDLSVQQDMRELLALQELLEPQMREIAHLFAQPRWAALAELQDKLRAVLHHLTGAAARRSSAP